MNEFNLRRTMDELSWRTSSKICPMKMLTGDKGTCEGYKCAWWNPHYGNCCIGTNYLALDYIGQSIGMLAQQIRAQSEES